MKLGVGYNVFCGTELLEYSIKQIREYVDFIVVSYQTKSWFGKNDILKKDMDILNDLKERKLIDKLNEFKIKKYASTNDEAQKIESSKRNQNRLICKENGMTHFLDMDVDEFYIKDQFIRAKNYIEDQGIPYSVVEYVNYYKSPIYQLERDPNDKRYCIFICEIFDDENIVFGGNHSNFVNFDGKNICIDRSRFYKSKRKIETVLFEHSDIMMHHMTGVRFDIREKYKNHPYSDVMKENLDYFSDLIDKVDINDEFRAKHYISKKAQIIKVPNYFNIPLKLFDKKEAIWEK